MAVSKSKKRGRAEKAEERVSESTQDPAVSASLKAPASTPAPASAPKAEAAPSKAEGEPSPSNDRQEALRPVASDTTDTAAPAPQPTPAAPPAAAHPTTIESVSGHEAPPKAPSEPAEPQPKPAEAAKPESKAGAYLITGVPGFIGKRLVEAWLEKTSGRFVLLVEARMASAARAYVQRLREPERLEIVEGDITLPQLGLSDAVAARLRGDIEVVAHLAAIYDLKVPENVARKVNVEGTENLLTFAKSCPNLRRFVHISTCYVSGRRTGVIFEDELDRGQAFKNHYESTKFLSEVLVRNEAERLPVTIIRPAIVIGDSATGETDKFDGPYASFRATLMGFLLFTPGKLDVPVNLVPVDFIVKATIALAEKADTVGKTFALADPNPMTGRDLIDKVADHFRVPRPLTSVPAQWVRQAIEVEAFEKFTGVTKQSMEYFNHLAIYDCRNTLAALDGSGIACPPLSSYLGRILDFWAARADLPFRLPTGLRGVLESLGLRG